MELGKQEQIEQFRRMVDNPTSGDITLREFDEFVKRLDTLQAHQLSHLAAKLPAQTTQSLKELNLESELVEQYSKIKAMMDSAMFDEEVPANQKAQVANSVVATLAQLVKLQEDLQQQEKMKVMESCLIDAIKVLPQSAKDEFFYEYERLATKAGLMRG